LVNRGLVADLGENLDTFADPRRDPWTAEVVSTLWPLAAEPGGRLPRIEASGLSDGALWDVLAGRSRPRSAAGVALGALAAEHWMCDGRRCRDCAGSGEEADPRRLYCSLPCRTRPKDSRTKPQL
jgi:hypothetical protein